MPKWLTAFVKKLQELYAAWKKSQAPATPTDPGTTPADPGTTPEPAEGCTCPSNVLAHPLVVSPGAIYDAANGEGALGRAGNSEECPVQAKDTRCRIVGSNTTKKPKIASWCKGHYRLMPDGKSVQCDCFFHTVGGVVYRFHYVGWGKHETAPDGADNPFPYTGTTFAFWEMRKA